MANVVVLHQYGCPFGVADRIYVIREIDITKEFLHEIIGLIGEVSTSFPQRFFREKKICFLSNQTIYKKFLSALAEEAKK